MEARERCITGGAFVPASMILALSPATGVMINHADAILFAGEVNPIYNHDLSDEQVLEILQDLAGHIGCELKHQLMYVMYKEEIYALERSANVV